MRERGTGALVAAGLRFAGAAVRGRGKLGLSRREFAGAVLQALRLHYFALPAGASLAGSAIAPRLEEVWRVAAAAAAAGVGWGVGQLVNDLMDTEADAVDAPDRPAVRGLLPDGPTVLVAMVLGLVVAFLATIMGAWLLGNASTRILSRYGSRFIFFATVGVVVAVIGLLARFGLATHTMGDAVILGVHDLAGWVLAGILVAWKVTPGVAHN